MPVGGRRATPDSGELRRRLASLEAEALEQLTAVSDMRELDLWRSRNIGRKSELARLIGLMGAVAPEGRRELGRLTNAVKDRLSSAADDARKMLSDESLGRQLLAETLDVSLPPRTPAFGIGRLHPLTQTIQEAVSILTRLGFEPTQTPEVELDYYNFESLNTPPWHPARDMQDTLYLEVPRVLMRTQATAFQARVMDIQRPPIRMLNVGRCHRAEATDATHQWAFYQIDGFAVDEGLTLADLRGVLTRFSKEFFWPNVKTRFRCDYFPFVEPGVDFSISCYLCDGDGRPDCGVCKGTGWLEILGAGSVHPNVLRDGDLDPEKYSGFAWGMGVDRLTLVKHRIADIRLFYGNDLRFLAQFKS